MPYRRKSEAPAQGRQAQIVDLHEDDALVAATGAVNGVLWGAILWIVILWVLL